ncbi:hypothetical protein PVL29_004571 [Vitis rotundifolia]|uniref:Uncharacterized protein n=1 Tax=Vitis rotundifolia TaxID=103349 RepID=A0AA39E2P0_VITRO|nr:hypothetical protein PVL29_004571 [Vitis rotundifolia]
MEKNKNRTDLLAAGRKKLQQFRQKKDGKGSSSQAKSSNKSGKSRQHEADANTVPATVNPKASQQVSDGEIGLQHLDSDVEFIDSSVSHSIENSMAPDIDAETIDPPSMPLSPKMGTVEKFSTDYTELPLKGSGVGENDVDSSVSNKGESIPTANPEVAIVGSLGDSEMAVSGGESIHANMREPVDVLAPPASVDDAREQLLDTVGTWSPRLEEERELLSSQEEFPDLSLIPRQDQVTDVGAMQEAESLGSKQLDRSSEIEIEGGVKLASSELRGSVETLAREASEVTVMEEATHEEEQSGDADDVSASAGAPDEVEDKEIHRRDKVPVCGQAIPEVDDSMTISSEVTNQQRAYVDVRSSNEEEMEMLSRSGDTGSNWKERGQPGAKGRMGDEVYQQEGLPEGSFVSEDKSHERPLETKILSLPRGWTVFPDADISSVGFSQLAELVKALNEDEFRFLLKSRDSASNAHVGNIGSLTVPESGLSDVLVRLKEQLYLTDFAKELHLCEQTEMQMDFCQRNYQLVNEISMLSASLSEVRERNKTISTELEQRGSELQVILSDKEELQNQLNTTTREIKEFYSRFDELQIKLERSQMELSSLTTELADSKDLVAALEVENKTLNETLASVMEGRKKIEEEKEFFLYENEKLHTDLASCNGLLANIQVEKADLKRSLASAAEQSKKLEEEREYFVHENEKLLAELGESKALVASLQVEITDLDGSLSLAREERMKLEEQKEFSVHENEKLSAELADCNSLIAALQAENANLNTSHALVMEERKKLEEDQEYLAHENERLSAELLVHQEQLSTEHGTCMQLELDLKEATMRLEQLTEENSFLNSSLDIHKAKISEIDHSQVQLTSLAVDAGYQCESSGIPIRGHQHASDAAGSHQIPGKQDREVFSLLERPLFGDLGELPELQQHKCDVYDDSFGFMLLKRHLQEVERIIRELEGAVEEMHSHSVSLSSSGAKFAASGVSKLIQAYESKGHLDDHEVEEIHSTEDQSPADPYIFAKEQGGILKAVLKELSLDVENACELFKGERDGKKIANDTCKELNIQYEALKEHSNSLEAMNIELEVLCEAMKQHGCDVEARKSELEVLYEALKQQDSSLKTENTELGKKLTEYQSRISELQSQLYDIQQSSDEMASTMYNQVENLQKEVTENELMLRQEWNSTIAQIVEAVGKLDATAGRFFTSAISSGPHDGFGICDIVATSVNAATKVIEDLQEKLEAALADHEAICSSYKEVNEKFNELHGKNEVAIDTLHKIYDDLRKLVNDSHGYVEESEINVQDKKLLDPINPSSHETLIEQLSILLVERSRLESVSNRLSTELMSRMKEIEELNKKGGDLNAILKLVENIEGVVKLEDMEIDSDIPLVSRLEILVPIIVQKCKEADEQVSFSQEEFGSKVIEVSDLQGNVNELNLLNLQQKNEILVLKESLRKAEEALVAARSELQEKVTELEQSEQRVSSVREKLSIAVAKGKGLIVQRETLKQSLAEISNELERCSQELQSKDARLHEVEMKLKTYSEAGERVEALESELSYIRNSATALRESFLLKDSVLQRIEEILEDLELPEHFHSRDIIEKIDWLARSVTGNSLPMTDWDQKSSVGGSYSDAGFVVMDAWKDDVQASSNPSEDLKRKYEELQGKFYGLAEQNEMLEQSLMERNDIIQRWEEVLDKISIPSQLRSMEPEDRIEWLGSALSEAHHDRDSLQQKIDNLETYCGSLTSDLEVLQRRKSELEAALQAAIHEKENLFDRLETLTCEHEKVSENAVKFKLENDKLQNEATDLQEKLVEKLGNEEHIRRIEDDIRRLQDLVSNVLQDPGSKELVSGGSGIEYLEELLRKLIENHTRLSLGKTVLRDGIDECHTENADTSSDEPRVIDAPDTKDLDVVVLKKELEEALGDLTEAKGERDRYMEKMQSLLCEVEALDRKREETQVLLDQEEQKSASLREKLNVAVRKGKSLVQHRDSLKQAVEEMNTKVENLKSEIELRDNALAEYEQKIKYLSTYPGRVEALESEILLLRNHLTDAEGHLQEKGHTLSVILNTLGDINVGVEFSVNDPVEKLGRIGKLCHDLHAAVASSEHESKKSKRAAELLLAELNEVQERNDALQDELAKTCSELSKLSKERDEAEASKLEALSSLRKLTTVHSEERKNQFSAFMVLKSDVERLRESFFDIDILIADVFSKNLEYFQSLKAGMESCLKARDAADVVGVPLISSPGGIISKSSENKFPVQNFQAADWFLDSEVKDHFDENFIVESCSFVGQQVQECSKEIGSLREKLHRHSISLHEAAQSLSALMVVVHGDMTSQRESFEFMKRELSRLESMEKEKDMELVAMRRNTGLLFESCTASIVAIENRKAQLGGNGVVARDLGINLSSDEGNSFGGNALLSSEEGIKTVAERLLLAVKDFASMQTEILDDSQKDMKARIADLQTELQEKDIQKERICMELVSQIRQAEATALGYSTDLQSANTQVHDLEKQVEVMEKERNVLEQRIKDLQDGEAASKELQEKVRSLADVVAAKEQEIEALMQALDEEEAQMEGLTNKIEELGEEVQQKNIDLQNLEASRGKALKKLSVTVSKFDELHHLSGSLLAEVEKLQSQLQDRDVEISFLRQEVTRCTNDVLVASQMNRKRNSEEINELLTCLDPLISPAQLNDVLHDDKKSIGVHEYKEILKSQIASIVSELEDLRAVAQSKDTLLQAERSKVEELLWKGETLENSLREKESQLTLLQDVGDSGQTTSMSSEIVEVKPVISKWAAPGSSIAPQVRSLRKGNNDQVAIAIDMDPGSSSRLEDEDDDKVHGFKSLTTSRIVPRFTRPVTDMIDGLWVSCDRALMRQPALRLGIIIYWAVMHALLATFVV